MGTASLLQFVTGWRSTHCGVHRFDRPGPCHAGPPLLCPAPILSNFAVNIALPHGRFNFGLVWIHFAMSASAVRRRNSIAVLCTDVEGEAVAISPNRATSPAIDRFVEGWSRANDTRLGGVHTSTSGQGALERCSIQQANSRLHLRWVNTDVVPPIGSYTLNDVTINYWVFEFEKA